VWEISPGEMLGARTEFSVVIIFSKREQKTVNHYRYVD
jgi:hypothetical protein